MISRECSDFLSNLGVSNIRNNKLMIENDNNTKKETITGQTSYNRGKKIAVSVVGGTTLATGLILTAPFTISALGFTSGGILAGSSAAAIMSTLGSGSAVVATLQSVGALGGLFAAKGGAVIVGGALASGAGVGLGLNKFFNIKYKSQ